MRDRDLTNRPGIARCRIIGISDNAGARKTAEREGGGAAEERKEREYKTDQIRLHRCISSLSKFLLASKTLPVLCCLIE